jgi:phosphoribosylglycinamide formyltransferase-1
LKKRIAIFASGSGSNAQKIMEHFKYHADAEVCLVLSNNADAFVLQRADSFEIPSHVFDRQEFYQTDEILDLLKRMGIDLIVLAGFLWLIPQNLLQAFPNRIINIHPSLLPKFGGKGMYGDHVHRAVLSNKEQEGGITIHYINENYDEGEYIFQGKYKIEPDDNLEMLKFKGQQLEHQHFPRVIESIVKKLNSL